jgi:hypothetical protein
VRDQSAGAYTLKQVYGSFSEPSGMAQFVLGTAFGCVYWWLKGKAPARVKTLAVVSLALLLLTFSTTAYAGIAIGVTLLVGRTLLRKRLKSKLMLAATTSVIAGLVWVGWTNGWLSEFQDFSGAVLDHVLLQKAQSNSYLVRALVDSLAFDGFLRTYGLGLGWGSTRGSSLVVHLLGNVGAIGMALLVWMAARLARQSRNVAADPRAGFIALALVGNLVGGVLSVPDINSVTLWLLLGLLVATLLPGQAAMARMVALRRGEAISSSSSSPILTPDPNAAPTASGPEPRRAFAVAKDFTPRPGRPDADPGSPFSKEDSHEPRQ